MGLYDVRFEARIEAISSGEAISQLAKAVIENDGKQDFIVHVNVDYRTGNPGPIGVKE